MAAVQVGPVYKLKYSPSCDNHLYFLCCHNHQMKGLPRTSTIQKSKPYSFLISLQNVPADRYSQVTAKTRINWNKVHIFLSFYFIFQNSNLPVISQFKIPIYQSSVNFNGWFWLKVKSRKTFDIIIFTKSVFFNFGFGGGAAALQTPPPPFWLTKGYRCTDRTTGNGWLKWGLTWPGWMSCFMLRFGISGELMCNLRIRIV
jgi:hypothetical protein